MAATTFLVVAHMPIHDDDDVFVTGGPEGTPKYAKAEWMVESRGFDAAMAEAEKYARHFRFVAVHTVVHTDYLPAAARVEDPR